MLKGQCGELHPSVKAVYPRVTKAHIWWLLSVRALANSICRDNLKKKKTEAQHMSVYWFNTEECCWGRWETRCRGRVTRSSVSSLCNFCRQTRAPSCILRTKTPGSAWKRINITNVFFLTLWCHTAQILKPDWNFGWNVKLQADPTFSKIWYSDSVKKFSLPGRFWMGTTGGMHT